MAFNVLTIRDAADDGSDAMYPVVGDESLVRLSEADGDVDRLVATAIEVREVVQNSQRKLLSLRDVKLEVFLTASRVAIACVKYDKGGGWVGFGGAGAAVALTANVVSKARAARRRRGKVLVGQVRHQWLAAVGYKPKTGWLSSEEVRLHIVDGTATPPRALLVDLTLPKNVDAAAVAQSIVRSAAAYRLRADTSFQNAERATFETLSVADRLSAPAPKRFAMYSMPTSYKAHPSNALGSRPEVGALR